MSSCKRKSKNEAFAHMSLELYDKLGTCRQFTTVWRALHLEVFPKILGKEFYGVPTLAESEYFDVFCVFVKDDSTCCQKTCCRCCKCSKPCPPVMRYVGTLKEMIDPERGRGGVRGRALCVEEGNNFNPCMSLPSVKYHYVGEFNNCRKEVHLELGGLRRLQSWLPILRDGDVYLKTKTPHCRNVYVVDVAYVVSCLKIETFGGLPNDKMRGNEGARWEFNNNVTIAFKFMKFYCKAGGKITLIKKSRSKKHKAKLCSWILPTSTHCSIEPE